MAVIVALLAALSYGVGDFVGGLGCRRSHPTLIPAGVLEQIATMAVAVDAGVRSGAFTYQNGDLARLIGRPTTSLVDGLRPLG
jgi:hypothetical protein